MPPRARYFWTACGIALSLALPIIGSIICAVGVPRIQLIDLPVHSLLETLGGLFAIFIAGILVVKQRGAAEDTDYFPWAAGGLASMGMLDLFHAAVPVGNNFVWLHAVASFVGGTLFACVWVGSRIIPRRFLVGLPWMAMLIATVVGIGSCVFQEALPAMSLGGQFTPLAKLLNIIGGLGFFIAGAFFIRRFHQNYDITDWLFAIQTTLFGVAGILFESSSLWDVNWWWWHGLRAIAYAAALVVAVRSYLGVERELIRVNKQLRDVNANLDKTVVSRTVELEETNAQLHRDRFLLNTLVDKTPDAVFFKDRDGRYLKVNHAMATDAGIDDPNEFVGKTEAEIWQGDASKEARDDERRIIETGVPILNKVEQLIARDGNPRWVLVTKMPLHDESGEIVGTFGVAREITEQKLTENELRESEARFRLLVEHAPDACVTLDVDEGRFCDANDHAEKLFRMKREELVKCHPVQLSPPLQPSGISSEELGREMIETALSGERMVFDWVHRDSEGNDIPCEVRLVPLPAGNRKLLQATIADMTRRKKAEHELTDARDAAHEANRELRRARDTAQEANRAKNDFLANVSHEIRTPMNAIIGMTDLVLDSELDLIQRDYLKTVAESAESLMSLIDEVLDFSKIEAGKLEIDSINFNLRQEINASLKSLSVRARANRVELSWHADDSVPEYVSGDPLRLRQILINLVGNGIKFAENGEVSVAVQFNENAPNNTELLFSVRDNGIGIPPGKIDSIFSAFEQVDTSATREYGGTGLGLAISSRLVNAMNGDLWVESTQGEGSAFYFTLGVQVATLPPDETCASGEPAAIADDAQAPELRSRESFSPDGGQPTPPLRILLVEDGKANRTMAIGLLSKWGHTVRVAENGQEAIEAHEQETFDVILMDLQMPEMDGIEATQKIRESEVISGQWTPIVAMTAHAMKGDRERCLEAGMDDYVSKPVRRPDLQRALSSVRKLESSRPLSGKRIGPDHDDAADVIIDWKAASEILGGDREFQRKLVREAVQKIQDLLPKLRDAIESESSEPAQRIANSVKTVARSIVATKTTMAANTVESAAANGDYDFAMNAFLELGDYVVELQHASHAETVEEAT